MKFEIVPWTQEHDCSQFTSSFASIQKFIKEQAARAVSSKMSTVFVLTEKGSTKVRGYYTLSSVSIKFDQLPKNVQKKLPRYPQAGATLLGRLGVDEHYRDELAKKEENPRLGELLIVDAQKNCLAFSNLVGSAIMLIDVEEPDSDMLARGAQDSMGFYLQYGFIALPQTPRKVFKSISTIEQELGLSDTRERQ